jgi:hypothetical protein
VISESNIFQSNGFEFPISRQFPKYVSKNPVKKNPYCRNPECIPSKAISIHAGKERYINLPDERDRYKQYKKS